MKKNKITDKKFSENLDKFEESIRQRLLLELQTDDIKLHGASLNELKAHHVSEKEVTHDLL